MLTLHSRHPLPPPDVRIAGVPVQYSAWIGSGNWKFPVSLQRLRQKIVNSDIIHLYGLYNLLAPLAAWLARYYHKPYTVEPLGMYTPRLRNQAVKRVYHRLFTHQLFANAAQIIATSQVEYAELLPLVSADRLMLRANGVDLDRFANLPDPAELRQRWQLRPTDKVALFVGRIHPIKNLVVLLQAFAQAELTHKLILVGPIEQSEYQAELQSLCQVLGLAERVIFAGPLYDTEQLAALALADFFVLPSQYESFGNAAAEAIAAGIPALVTTGCGIAPLLHQKAGLAVPPTVAGLVFGLQTLADSVRRAVLCSDLATVRQSLSWQRPVAQMRNFYQQLQLT